MTDSQLNQLFHKIALENDQRAFGVFFDLYQTKLLRYANLFMKNMEESEDVVSEVLIKLLKKREEVFLKENFLGFLFKCIKNQCLDQLKKEKRRSNSIDANYHEADYFTFESQTPFTKLVHNELDQLIKERIENLPPKRRMVFKMVKDDNLSQKEVAELMDISVRTVEVHLKLALQDLKLAVDEYLSRPGRDGADKMQAFIAFSLLIMATLE